MNGELQGERKGGFEAGPVTVATVDRASSLGQGTESVVVAAVFDVE